MSSVGATGPAPIEGNVAPAIAANADPTDLEIQESHRQAERRAARLGVPPKKTNGAAPDTPFPLGERIDTGIVAEWGPRSSRKAKASSEKSRRASNLGRTLSNAAAKREKAWGSRPRYNRILRTFRRNSNHCLTGFFGGTYLRNPTDRNGAKSLSSQMGRQLTRLIALLGAV